MDFIIALPIARKHNDSIMVVIDKLTKVAHFIPVKYTHKAINIANIFMKDIFKMHRLPKKIISNRDTKLTSNLWKILFKGLDTQFSFRTAYHPYTNSQIKRTNSICKDMLQMYVMDFPVEWKDYLHLVEFAYNNGYQYSF